MSAFLSTSKASALLTRGQLNPEMGTDTQSHVEDLSQRAAGDLVSEARLPRYPELSKGYSKSVAGASEDISGIASNSLLVSVNGSLWITVEPTLASCNTGDNCATELQSIIRAESTEGFDEVTVAFAGTQYTATSGRYGEASAVNFSWLSEDSKHVALELGLSPDYGGTEVAGMAAREEADDFVVEATEILYRKVGLEGIESGTVPGDISFKLYADELSPSARRMLANMRVVFG